MGFTAEDKYLIKNVKQNQAFCFAFASQDVC